MQRTFGLAVLVLLLAASALHAQQRPMSSFDKVTKSEPAPSTTVRGTVLSMSGRTLAIETKDGNRMEFEIDADSALPTAVYEGASVLVTYGPRDTGISRIVRVEQDRGDSPAGEGEMTGLPPHTPPAAVPSEGSGARGVNAPVESGSGDTNGFEPAPIQRTPPKRYVAPVAGVLLVGGAVGVWALTRRRSA
jgi:hypothetical protein